MDLSDALHPIDGPNPEQPALPLGASPLAVENTEGSPPFVMRRLSLGEWDSYIARYAFPWQLPRWITLHHTWKPRAEDWRGLASMRAMQTYYRGLGWTSAPHLYAAQDGIWLATPLDRIGIHAGSGNGSLAQGWYSIGLEMVGDFDRLTPAGLTWTHTLAVLRGIARRCGRNVGSMLNFHRDFSTKSCPGHAVTRAWVLSQAAEPPRPVEEPMTRVIGVRPSVTFAAWYAWLIARKAPLDQVVAGRVYDLAAWLDIDPAFVAAVWAHETSQTPGVIGSSDLYRKSHNAGAIVAYGRWPSVTHNGRQFNAYESPQLGLFGLVLHLKSFYGARGLLDVETIIPVYAPAADGNAPTAYIAAVKRSMAAMRGGA